MQRFLQAGCGLAMLALAATPALAAPPAPPAATAPAPMMQHKNWQAMRQTILDGELTGFKASLSLTPQQQALWPAFETALRAMPAAMGPHHGPWMHGRRMDEHGMKGAGMKGPGMKEHGMKGAAMHEHAGMPPSPADMMHRIAQHLTQRAMQLDALSKATGPLYASLSVKQQLVFRVMLFRLGFMHPGPAPWMHHHR